MHSSTFYVIYAVASMCVWGIFSHYRKIYSSKMNSLAVNLDTGLPRVRAVFPEKLAFFIYTLRHRHINTFLLSLLHTNTCSNLYVHNVSPFWDWTALKFVTALGAWEWAESAFHPVKLLYVCACVCLESADVLVYLFGLKSCKRTNTCIRLHAVRKDYVERCTYLLLYLTLVEEPHF